MQSAQHGHYTDEKGKEAIRSGAETETASAQLLKKWKRMLPKYSQLELYEDTMPECIEIDKLLCKKIEELSGLSMNLNFLGKVGLLELLIP